LAVAAVRSNSRFNASDRCTSEGKMEGVMQVFDWQRKIFGALAVAAILLVTAAAFAASADAPAATPGLAAAFHRSEPSREPAKRRSLCGRARVAAGDRYGKYRLVGGPLARALRG